MATDRKYHSYKKQQPELRLWISKPVADELEGNLNLVDWIRETYNDVEKTMPMATEREKHNEVRRRALREVQNFVSVENLL